MTNLPNKIFLCFDTYLDTKSWDFGRRLFEIFEMSEHRMPPKYIWGMKEKEKQLYTEIETARPFWHVIGKNGVDWISWVSPADPRPNGRFSHTGINVKGNRFSGSLSLTVALSPKVDIPLLFERLCRLLEVEDAFLHQTNGTSGHISTVQQYSHKVSLSSWPRIVCPWINFHAHSGCLIPKYLTDPIFASVQENGFPTGHIGAARLVSVSESPFDMLERPDWYAERRALLRRLLNPEGHKTFIHLPNPDGTTRVIINDF